VRRWPTTSLLDMLKETDLRVGFTDCLTSVATQERLERDTIQKRLLLCLYGLGTNTGLKRVAAGDHGESYPDLRYVRRRFIRKEQLRASITAVANATLEVRQPHIWGEGTTACASDSKKFGAWDENLMTEWHIRYGGRGVMIYWHVERKSLCIYSQLRACSSSEVAAMIEGLVRHCTDMTVERNYVDSHGQSEVAFAFCHLLGFHLLPRLKGIHAQKLYRPVAGQSAAYPNLQPILTRPINWELIANQYDEMVKFATALRIGTAETEAILRRFTRETPQHHLPGPCGAGQGGQDGFSLRLLVVGRPSPGDPRGAQRGRELELGQRLRLLRQGRGDLEQPARRPGAERPVPAPPAVLPRLRQHPPDPARPR
jgi:hypothetical protein